MLIGVVVSGWEQGCCGAPFRVGDDVDWEVFWAREGTAAMFGAVEAAGVDFAETHHGIDDALRLVRVKGRVASIHAMSQLLHRPAPAGPWTNVKGEATGEPVDHVPGRERVDAEAGAAVPPRAPESDASPPAVPPQPGEPGVFLAPGGGWFTRRGLDLRAPGTPRIPPADEPTERRVPAGWIVHLDVPAGTPLPEGPTPGL